MSAWQRQSTPTRRLGIAPATWRSRGHNGKAGTEISGSRAARDELGHQRPTSRSPAPRHLGNRAGTTKAEFRAGEPTSKRAGQLQSRRSKGTFVVRSLPTTNALFSPLPASRCFPLAARWVQSWRARWARRVALAMSVKVKFFAGSEGNVEPSAQSRFSKGRQRPARSVVKSPPSTDIGSVPA